MGGAQPRLGATLRLLGARLAVALTVAVMAVVVPVPEATVRANGATGLIISTTTVSGDINPSLTGQTVTFTATVAGDPITNYTDASISSPVGIAVGPDGALWFTNYDNDSIGRITTAGVVTNYTDAGIDAPLAIVAGPDGALWFTSYNNDKIGKITTAGAVTLYTDALLITKPQVIAVGPDANLWFADGGTLNQRTIGRITTAGVVTAFSDGPAGCDEFTDICEPVGIAAGSDGALWYTNSGSFPVLGGSIGRITTAGVRTHYTGTGVSTPLYITAGPDSALWFTNIGNNSIGRSDTTGAITNYTSATISGPREIAAGSDGNLWFGNYVGDSIGRITPAGVVTSYAAASVNGPYGVVSGPDGAIWFTNFDGDSIGRISPAAPGGGTPTGTVQFKVDGSDYGAPVALDGAGQAQIAISSLAVGDHTVAAVYSGDVAFMASASDDLSQAVNPPDVLASALVVLREGGQMGSAPVLLTITAAEGDNLAPTVWQVQLRRLYRHGWGSWSNRGWSTGIFEDHLSLWRTYQYRVREVIGEGYGDWVESNTIALRRRDEGQFQRSAGWTIHARAGAMQGDVATSSTEGAWASRSFFGDGVGLVMPTGPGLGAVEACLDPGQLTEDCRAIDLAAYAPIGNRVLVAVFAGLPMTSHVLRVTMVSGTAHLDGAIISRGIALE